MSSVIVRAFRVVSLATAVAFVAACAGQEARHSAGVTAPPPVSVEAGPSSRTIGTLGEQGRHAGRNASGDAVVADMLARFDDSQVGCGPNMIDPKLKCSGVYMRATKRGNGFHIWNPNPDSPNKNAVSFSWLTRLGSFGDLVFGYDNGFTILPVDQAWRGGFNPVDALCLFPYDAATWQRSNDGCGAYPGIADSGPCQAQGITERSQWIGRFGHRGMYGHQCGFDATLPNAMWAIFQGWEVRTYLPNWHKLHNEVMVRAWRQDDPGLPLDSFFYIGGSGGRSEAMANQRDFKEVIGRWVPVVQIVLPDGDRNNAYFRYLPEDQAVPEVPTASAGSTKH